MECGIDVRCGKATAAECLRSQFAAVAPLRSALHSYRTFVTRGLYLIDRCGFDSDVLQVYPMRDYNFRHAGVLFPAALITVAANKVSLRVQSERSERLRELPSAGTHRRRCCLICYRPFQGTYHAETGAARQAPPILFRGGRNCSTGQWRYRLSAGIYPIPRYISVP